MLSLLIVKLLQFIQIVILVLTLHIDFLALCAHLVALYGFVTDLISE